MISTGRPEIVYDQDARWQVIGETHMKKLRTTLSSDRFIRIVTGLAAPQQAKLSTISKARRQEIVSPKDVSTRKRTVKTSLNKSMLQRILASKVKLQRAKLSVARKGEAIVIPRNVSES